jgi:type IV pilus assembly protein PilO
MGRADRNKREKAKRPSLSEQLEGLSAQFRELDREDPGSWPAGPRYLACALTSLAVVAALWFVWLSDVSSAREAAEIQEKQLRDDFSRKLAQVANLDALRKQREQAVVYVTQLEKQLPSRAEMDALLSDINQAGVGRSLQFELFRPGQVVVRDYYAELPISVRLTGRFSDMGVFAADIASLSRIVTLGELSIQPVRDGSVVLDATVRTYRYLDDSEASAQRKAAGAKK